MKFLILAFIGIIFLTNYANGKDLKRSTRSLNYITKRIQSLPIFSLFGSNEEEHVLKPTVSVPAYPIWKVHKYNGVHLKPIPFGSIPFVKIPVEDSAATKKELHLPSIDQLKLILGTTSAAETLDALRELLSTRDGLKLVAGFIKASLPDSDIDIMKMSKEEIDSIVTKYQYSIPAHTDSKGSSIDFSQQGPPIKNHVDFKPFINTFGQSAEKLFVPASAETSFGSGSSHAQSSSNVYGLPSKESPSAFNVQSSGVTNFMQQSVQVSNQPQNIYGSLQNTYGPPPNTHGPPQNVYGPPHNTYGPPVKTDSSSEFLNTNIASVVEIPSSKAELVPPFLDSTNSFNVGSSSSGDKIAEQPKISEVYGIPQIGVATSNIANNLNNAHSYSQVFNLPSNAYIPFNDKPSSKVEPIVVFNNQQDQFVNVQDSVQQHPAESDDKFFQSSSSIVVDSPNLHNSFYNIPEEEPFKSFKGASETYIPFPVLPELPPLPDAEKFAYFQPPEKVEVLNSIPRTSVFSFSQGPSSNHVTIQKEDLGADRHVISTKFEQPGFSYTQLSKIPLGDGATFKNIPGQVTSYGEKIPGYVFNEDNTQSASEQHEVILKDIASSQNKEHKIQEQTETTTKKNQRVRWVPKSKRREKSNDSGIETKSIEEN